MKFVSFAKSASIKTSVQKLSLVTNMIKGLHVFDAINQLKLCRKKVALDVSAVLNSAISNAENNFYKDLDGLYVGRIDVGKSFTLRRNHARGRGRSAPIQKPYSQLTIYIDER